MIIMPIKREDKPPALILILTPENLARMKQGDPYTMNFKDVGGPDVDLILAYEGITDEKIRDMAEKQDLSNFLKYLFRGFTMHPDDGTAPVRIGKVGK